MRGSDPEGKSGPSKSLPDTVTVIEPKEESSVITPTSQDYGAKAAAAAAAQQQAAQAEAAAQETTVEGGQEYSAPAETPAENAQW